MDKPSEKSPILNYSFGFDCQKLGNLCVVGNDTLAYVTGRLLHYFNINDGTIKYMESSSTHGIGAIAIHPTRLVLAVGEIGQKPDILLYNWPSLSITATLKNGALEGYSCLNFNAEGSLLASVSSSPDHMLTIWIWEQGEIQLQSKAFQHDVYAVAFSAFYADQLATCGVGHLKMWKINETFTGLKLQGELHRFGKTDQCDILGILPLPDGSCATGSQWGNILIWTDGVIKLEIFRVGGLPCHIGAVTQVMFHNDALLSAGFDGAIRVWHYETIELADPAEEDPRVEMEPMFELLVRDSFGTSEILNLCKATVDPDDNLWYSLDKSGAIWRVMLSTQVGTDPPERVFSCHAGPVVSIQASPADTFFASLGADGRVIFFDYVQEKIIASRRFGHPGTCLLWLPISVVADSTYLVAGFANGVLRLLKLNGKEVVNIGSLKLHTRDITSVVIFDDTLLTISADSTAFIVKLKTADGRLMMSPVGFCRINSVPTCVAWTSHDCFTVGSDSGQIFAFSLPSKLESSKLTYELSLKYDVRDIKDSDDENCYVRFLLPLSSNRLILGCDFGLLELDSWTVVRRIPCMALTAPAVSALNRGREIILGLDDGKIHAVRFVNSELISLWVINVHSKAVTQLSESYDGKYFFSCGLDSGVFSFGMSGEKKKKCVTASRVGVIPVMGVVEKEEIGPLSLEEAKIKENEDRKLQMLEDRKRKIKAAVDSLRSEYEKILADNESLPEQLRVDDLVPCQKVVDDLNLELKEKMDLVYRKLARDSERSQIRLEKVKKYFLGNIETLCTRIYAIETDSHVETFRLTRLPADFHDQFAKIQKKIAELEARGSLETIPEPPEVPAIPRAESPDPVEALIKQVSVLGEVSRNRKLSAVLKQHRARRQASAARQLALEDLLKRKPDGRLPSVDMSAVEFASESFGDFKLKKSTDCKVPKHKNNGTMHKLKSMLETQLRIYETMKKFNDKIFNLRRKKEKILFEHTNLRKNFELTKPLPPLPVFKIDEEFPEEILTETSEKNHELIFPEDKMGDEEFTEEYRNDIIDKMWAEVHKFDEEMVNLSEEKIEVEVSIKMLELHFLTLRREVLILQQFEEEEACKAEKSFNLLKNKYDIQLRLNSVSREMENVIREVHSLEENLKTLISTFLGVIAENKFYDYLRKIFRRKVTKKSENSDSSESESESDEEVKSFDSKQSVTHFNENFCPEGCDENLYNLTFKKREERYLLEGEISEKKRAIDTLKKNFEKLAKEMTKLDIEYENAEEEYGILQKNKQELLNKVETVVVLRLSQMQNLDKGNEPKSDYVLADLDKSLVMNNEMLSQLHGRVGELTRETQQQKDRHEHNKEHIKRLGIDIRYMMERIDKLEKEKRATMLRKFGAVVDLDELDEALVKKFIAEMDFIAYEMQQKLDFELDALKVQMSEKVDAYTARLMENTKRYNILTVLKDERNKIEKVLDRKETADSVRVRSGLDQDVKELSETVKNYEGEILKLKQDIFQLRQKASSIPLRGVTSPISNDSNPIPFTKINPCKLTKIQQISSKIKERLNDFNPGELKIHVENIMELLPDDLLRPIWEELCGDSDEEMGKVLENREALEKAAGIILNLVENITHV